LQAAKDLVKGILEIAETNYKVELNELKPIDLQLNRVFLGPADTGKTTVAKLYGQILVTLNLLSNGEGIASASTSNLPYIY
jgi:predicted AAA+ superfamily ATPase